MSAQLSNLACTYAVLLLQDEGLPIDAAKINKLIENAHITGVEKFYAKLYATNLTQAVITSTISSGGSTNGAQVAASSSSAAAPAAAAAKDDKKAPAPEVEKKEEKKDEPEEDLDMGDLFG